MTNFGLKSTFVKNEYSYPCLPWPSDYLLHHSLSFHFQSLCVSVRGSLDNNGWALFFSEQLASLCLLIGELRSFKFRIIIEIPVILLFYFLVDSSNACSFLFPLVLLEVCWFAELNMFDSFIIFMY
jgi:hypothetical protein